MENRIFLLNVYRCSILSAYAGQTNNETIVFILLKKKIDIYTACFLYSLASVRMFSVYYLAETSQIQTVDISVRVFHVVLIQLLVAL